MSDIKSVIALLCKHLKISFNVNVKPEHFRLSKFNKTEDSCVSQMWEILYKICNEIHPQMDEDNIVNFVKLSFAMMEYNSLEFYCLPSDMSSGSRELLLALGWLLLVENVLEKSTTMKLRKSPMNMEFDVTVSEQTGDCPSQHVFKSGSLESSLNSILVIAGKIRHNINTIAEMGQSRVTFATKIHQSTINSCGLPHLSANETKLIRCPHLIPEYLNKVGENSNLIETHRQWLKKCHIFWEWMESVITEKECGSELDHLSVHEKKTLFLVLNTLRLRTKACLLQCQRTNNYKNISHQQSLSSIQGVPRCILQTKGKDIEMGQLLTDSEQQLQEVKNLYLLKKSTILPQIHELASQMPNVIVLFPELLK